MLLSTILAALGVLSCTSAARVSTDGSCGNVRGKQLTCLKSSFGSCCSQHGWCGSSPAYCAAGCKSAFGSCNGASPSSMLQSTTRSSVRISGTPPPQPLAKNGRCGPDFGGRTCLGSEWGNCCSQYSYCGSTPDYCAPRSCQTGFGLCDASSSSSSSARATTSMSAHALSVASASSSTAVSASTPSVVSSLSLAAAVSSTPLVTSTSSTSDTSVSSRTSISDIIASSSSQAIPVSPTRSTIPSPSAICTSQILTNGDFESGSLSPFASYCPVQNNCGGFSVEPETGNTANHVYQFTSREYGCGGHLRQTVNLPSTQVTISCSFRYRVVSGTSPNLQIYAQIGSQYCTGSAGSYVGVTADWTTISGTLGPIQGSPNTAYLWVNFGSDDRPGPVLQMDDFVVTYCYQPS